MARQILVVSFTETEFEIQRKYQRGYPYVELPVCNLCGSVVQDTAQHIQFHIDLEGRLNGERF